MTGDRLTVTVVSSVDERLPSTRPVLRALELLDWDVVVRHPPTRRPAPTVLPTALLPAGRIAASAALWDRHADAPATDLVVVVQDGHPLDPAVRGVVGAGPTIVVVGPTAQAPGVPDGLPGRLLAAIGAPDLVATTLGPLLPIDWDAPVADLTSGLVDRLRTAADAAVAVEPLARGLLGLTRAFDRAGLGGRPAVARVAAQGVVDLFDPPPQHLHGGRLSGGPAEPEEEIAP
jgi:hypothetical protein